ncbi:hypothetical protein SRHO_G00180370 [Serrasalmus rhombeus]
MSEEKRKMKCQANLLISLRMSLTVSLLVLIFISDDPEYRGRVQYLEDKQPNDTLRLKNVTAKDQSKYYFRFSTNQPGGKYQREGGVDLSITDLQVEVPERVMEGDNVTLTCKTTCSLTVRPTFTWYRNGHPLSSSTDPLHLQLVSREDASRYRCVVLGQNLRSPKVTLNVRYGPKSVSVSISPSGEIVEGSSVTLTCSSDANPPVGYNWFKGTSLVAKRETYMMNISSVDSGEYKCKSSNEHGVKYSTALTLNVLYPPRNVSVSIGPSGETAEGSSVNLTCSSDANPPVQNYTWFKEGGSSPVGSGHSYRALQRGSYYCEAQNEHGSQKSAAENLYSNVAVRSATSDAAPDPDPSNQDDVHYASVRNPRNAESSVVTASVFGAEEEVHYASIQHCHDKVVETTEGDNIQYASVRFTHPDSTKSSAVSRLDDVSVIYSKMP